MPTTTTILQALKSNGDAATEEKKDYIRQAARLGLDKATGEERGLEKDSTYAVRANFVTAQDPIIETANGGRLPAVPLEEAVRLNKLRDVVEGRSPSSGVPVETGTRHARDGTVHGALPEEVRDSEQSQRPDASLRDAIPPSRTNPLFPPLPLYGPPSVMRSLHCLFFRFTSFFLSMGFLLIIILGAAFTSVPRVAREIWLRVTSRDPEARRPFHAEEARRRKERKSAEQRWSRVKKARGTATPANVEKDAQAEKQQQYIPTEGGPDPLICDIGYYARREGLASETFEVQTEDGFIIELQHIYNPLTHKPAAAKAKEPHSPTVFNDPGHPDLDGGKNAPKRYPILLLHGLLQSAGAYCCTGPSSLAFYLTKAGYDVWLGNNRCGMEPRHTQLSYGDPRMWAWNIRQMGVLDLTALVSRVLSETHSPKLALVAHSQGTTQTLVALAKEQRPELGRRISVFCALAPAAYAGPLIGKAYFKFMRVISYSIFKLVFGIHSFIPFMMTMHKILPGKLYGDMGYLVFSFMFNWSDDRWDRGLRARCFQFAPTYVSAESMRWWLGKECFATQKCILATREEGQLEDREDEEEDEVIRQYYEGGRNTTGFEHEEGSRERTKEMKEALEDRAISDERGRYAWYNEDFPALAMWVAGADGLVDGRRLLRRFDRGREPHVRVVHKKIIEGYEHLDVIWAMDCVDKVGSEIKDVVWRTVPEQARRSCQIPDGCAELQPYDLDTASTRESKGDRSRDSVVEGQQDRLSVSSGGPISPTMIDATAGDWADGLGSTQG